MKRIAICTPAYASQIMTPYMLSANKIRSLLVSHGYDVLPEPLFRSDALVPRGRLEITRRALAAEVDALLWIDGDQRVHEEEVLKLVQAMCHDESHPQLLGLAVPMKDEPNWKAIRQVAMRFGTDQEMAAAAIHQYACKPRHEDLDASGRWIGEIRIVGGHRFVPVERLGTGVMLVDAPLVNKMLHTHGGKGLFATGMRYGRYESEDYDFVQDAIELSVTPLVLLDSNVTHFGVGIWRGNFEAWLRAMAEGAW